MRNKYIDAFEADQVKVKNVPDFRAGDTIKVAVIIKEGEKSRIQYFEGLCIAIRGTGTGKTFIVRKIGANAVGVERILPLYSDSIDNIQVLRRGKVRRAKLYYQRTRRGKSARIKERKRKDTKKA